MIIITLHCICERQCPNQYLTVYTQCDLLIIQVHPLTQTWKPTHKGSMFDNHCSTLFV